MQGSTERLKGQFNSRSLMIMSQYGDVNPLEYFFSTVGKVALSVSGLCNKDICRYGD